MSCTVLLPRAEVKDRDVAALCVTRPARPKLEGFVRHLSDTSVVTDDAGKRRSPQGIPLGLSEDSIVLPPKSENDSLMVLKVTLTQIYRGW